MDERLWTDAPLTPDAPLRAEGLEISAAPPAAAYLVSGPLDALPDLLGRDIPVLGFLGDAAGQDPVALRISRHTALLVSNTPLDLPLGWSDGGFAISEAPDLYARFRLSGPRARDVLAEGGVVPDAPTSPSAAFRFAGLTALLSRDGPAVHLWVPTAQATYIATFLRKTVG